MVKLPHAARHIVPINKGEFGPSEFLATMGEGKQVLSFPKGQTVFTQGEVADAVFYILRGKVQLAVVSSTGKEATTGIVGVGDFFGEACLMRQPLRTCSATVIPPCTLLRIARQTMVSALHREHSLSELFVDYLLTRNIRYEEDLIDQLFNSSEKRLARILLLLARFGNEGVPALKIQNITQQTLGEMVGTTRPRVSFFMNKFRKLGYISYDGNGIRVFNSLVDVVLKD